MISSSANKFFFALKSNKLQLIILFLLSVILYSKNLLLGGTLWWDEAMLADNIISRSYLELFKPLEWFQTAPIGYLFIVKLLASVTGYSDIGFRLISYICGLFIPSLFYLVVSENTNVKLTSLIFSIIICFNPYIIFYANELKPYILDIFLTILLLLAKPYELKNYSNPNYYFLISIFFIFGGLFFNYYYFFSTSLLIYLFFLSLASRKNTVIPLLAIGFLSLFCYYLLLIRNNPHSEFMHRFWKEADAFTDISNGLLFAIKTTYWNILIVFRHFFYFKITGLFFLFTIALAILLLIRKPGITVWLILPMILHTGLSICNIYPMSPRLQLPWIIHIYMIFALSLNYLKMSKIRFPLAIVIFLLTLPWNQLPYFLYKPIIKCNITKTIFDLIPEHSTVYLSESTVPLFHINQIRNNVTEKKVNFLFGTGSISDDNKTSQTYGIINNKCITIIEQIREIKDVQNLYILLHNYNHDITSQLVKELSECGNVSMIKYDSTITFNHILLSQATAAVLIKFTR